MQVERRGAQQLDTAAAGKRRQLRADGVAGVPYRREAQRFVGVQARGFAVVALEDEAAAAVDDEQRAHRRRLLCCIRRRACRHLPASLCLTGSLSSPMSSNTCSTAPPISGSACDLCVVANPCVFVTLRRTAAQSYNAEDPGGNTWDI